MDALGGVIMNDQVKMDEMINEWKPVIYPLN